MSGHKRNSKALKEKKPLFHGWIVVPSKSYPDRVYFYNTVSKCSTWNNPCENNANENDDSSSETSRIEKKRLLKSTNKSSKTSYFDKQKSKTVLHSPDRNCNIKINHEIEDYDENQDQYFDNVSFNACNLSDSIIISPSRSSNSSTSSKSSICDTEKQSESNVLLGDNKKQLWVHFVSSPEKFSAKKSIALSDFDETSAIRNLELEMSQETEKNILVRNLSKDMEQNYLRDESAVVNSSKSKKTKRKRKAESGKTVTEKTVKNVFFKKRDKTPAQTRLLKLRQQNAERLKELAAENPSLGIGKKNSIDSSIKVKSCSDNFFVEGEAKNDNFSDAHIKRIELCNNTAQEEGNYSKADFSEEMDWEPTSEESDVRNINVFRQQVEKTSEVSRDIFFGTNLDHSVMLPSKSQSWFLVLDTNIFVSCLSFIKELRDTKVPELGYPIIYVPWRVLQELDHLKDTKIDAVDKNLHVQVRKAIGYLNDNFKSRHPRVCGQSFEDFASMVDVEISAPDDEILQTCIQLQKKQANKLMLLTNDKNLETKAIVSGIEVYSKERFQKKYLNSSYVSPTCSNAINPSNKTGVKIDDCLCEVKAIMKDFMSSVVETEMKIAFDGDWIKLVYRKPPWSLQDVLDCLLKHWMSVFFVNFSKEAHSEAQFLYEKLFKRAVVSTGDIIEIIKTSQRLILSIKRSQKKERPYIELISTKMTKLSNLLEMLSANEHQADGAKSTSLFSSASAISSSLFHSQKVFQDKVISIDVTKVKNLFKDIWDSLRSFCCTVSDVMNSPGVRDDPTMWRNPAVQEIRLKLLPTLNEIEELVVTVESIFELNVADICDLHPLIVYFSNFLIRVYPAMALDTKNELPKSLAAFFMDFEGRSILGSSLKDFREFIQDLSKAIEYFNTHAFNTHFSC